MNAFYDKDILTSLNGKRIVIDTNILAICSTDNNLITTFDHLFANCYLMLDPIVKLEFLKGAQTESLFQKKKNFLEFRGFYEMPDHQQIYKEVQENALNIARIYSHHKHPEIKLGDILIISRLMIYPNYYLLTLDKDDFTTMLFNRIGIISFEHRTLNKPSESLELNHACIIKFDSVKYNSCLKKINK